MHGHVLKAEPLRERARSFHILRFVIAQESGGRASIQRMQRFENVTSAARGDVEDVHAPASRLRFLNCLPQQLFQMNFPLPDAAPTNRAEYAWSIHRPNRVEPCG